MTAMSIVAHSHAFVVGVDTHARNHVYAIITAQTGELIDTKDFPTTGAGINRAIAWVARRTGADLAALWVIEGAASYGAILAGAVAPRDTRLSRQHGWTPEPTAASANPTSSMRNGSPGPCSRWRRSNCAGRG